MTIVIPRHTFRMGNVAVITEPVVAAAQEAVEGMETSEDDRYESGSSPSTCPSGSWTVPGWASSTRETPECSTP